MYELRSSLIQEKDHVEGVCLLYHHVTHLWHKKDGATGGEPESVFQHQHCEASGSACAGDGFRQLHFSAYIWAYFHPRCAWEHLGDHGAGAQ